MPGGISYYRRADGGLIKASSASEVFPDWQGAGERWMFVGAHDDDIVIGSGLMVLAAVAEGIEVHAVITTDGRMGYCREEQRADIVEIRRGEAEQAFGALGVPVGRLHFLGLPDCDLNSYVGRRRASDDDDAVIMGHTGVQNAYTYTLRRIVPTRVLVPTAADLHPDHKIANQEMMISLFHAQGEIWPELGDPIPAVPKMYEYVTYSTFPETPQIKLAATDEMLATKLDAISAFVSQRQISALVEQLRLGGPTEYLREVKFKFYSPRDYSEFFLDRGGSPSDAR